MENSIQASKKWYLSWTIWVNIGVIILESVNQIGQFVPLPTGVLLVATNLLNILLRFKTVNGITK